MPVRSMTGFGRGESASGGVKVAVELSAVNRKQFDLRASLPRALASLEPRLYEMVHAAISRGFVTAAVHLDVADGARERFLRVDERVARAYLGRLRRMAAGLGVPGELTIRDLMTLPGVVDYDAPTEDAEVVWPLIRQSTEAALRGLLAMKSREGETLAGDLARRLGRLGQRLARIEKRVPAVATRYRAALRKRLADAGAQLESNDHALLREIALFADRSDVSEETTRLRSHLEQAAKLLKSGAAVGRTLDFLCQEMAREINTIGSKANDLRITRETIGFKADLESVREQVQNLE
jgi:uncharacterized protein (TIGR00255 family)